MALRNRTTTPPRREWREWTVATFRARGLELMVTHGAGWWSCRSTGIGLAEDGELAWIELTVPSASRADTLYDARYEAASDSASCTCIAAQRGQPCWHVGVAIAAGRRAVEINRSYLLVDRDRFSAWEDNERTIQSWL